LFGSRYRPMPHCMEKRKKRERGVVLCGLRAVIGLLGFGDLEKKKKEGRKRGKKRGRKKKKKISFLGRCYLLSSLWSGKAASGDNAENKGWTERR